MVAGRLDGFLTFDSFADVTRSDLYRALPDDWIVGLTDVVRSTEAVAAGRYKAVNVAGAAAISAVINAIGSRHFPFAFGGDGSAFALPPVDAEVARHALAATAAWVRDDIGLELRASLVDVGTLRAAGAAVRVALFRPSPHVAYAMFDGGGIALAERRMKAGLDAVPAAVPGVRPDLSGLSCRWLPIGSQNGAIVSIIVRPGEAGDAAFRAALDRLLALLFAAKAVHPVPDAGASPALLSPGLSLEVLAQGGPRRALRLLRTALHNAMGWALFRTGLRLGAFDPVRYRALTAQNADTKKFGDGLALTADCDPALEALVRDLLAAAAAEGALRYGLHRQDAALMTCIVPSYGDDGHFHFIDGAGGGYTAAARNLRGAEALAGSERSGSPGGASAAEEATTGGGSAAEEVPPALQAQRRR